MIGIFDSGVGGLSVYREVRKALPQAGIWYFGDTAYCPYGPRERSFVISRAEAITEMMLKGDSDGLNGDRYDAGQGVDIIVVACNTATAAAISHLREKYSDRANPQVRERVLGLTGGRMDHVMFIGMEPAVKPAVNSTKTGVVGVLATAGTLKGQKYHDMKDLFKGDVKVVEQVGEGFVELVEKWDTDSPEAERTVARSLAPLIAEGADTIVLGCTHYPFLTETIRRQAALLAPGRDIQVIDPAPAVTRHLMEVMQQEGIPFGDEGAPTFTNASGDVRTIARIAALTGLQATR
ncbi:MAG: glutamate racemase [Candidatus Cryptobacteroides sp.]